MYKLIYSQATHIGRQRKNNEDAMLAAPPENGDLNSGSGALFALADGLGGLPNGEIASQESVLLMGRLYKEAKTFLDPLWLREAILKINETIRSNNEGLPIESAMATTLTVSWFFRDILTIGHVGDCRVYQIREGQIFCLTQDHATDRNTLTRVIGIDGELEVDLYQTEIKSGDIYIQCSDGLYSMVSDKEMMTAAEEAGPVEICEQLVLLANRNGGLDNITVQVVCISDKRQEKLKS